MKSPLADLPDDWRGKGEPVMMVTIRAPMGQRSDVINWFYDNGGVTTKSGPAPKGGGYFDLNFCVVSGHVPITPQ